MSKGLKDVLQKKEIEMSNEHLKWLSNQKIQIKNTVRYYCRLTRLPKVRNYDHTEYWEEYEAKTP